MFTLELEGKISSNPTQGVRETASVTFVKTYLRVEASSGGVPVPIFEQELVHDEHSQGNELPLGHLYDGDLGWELTSEMQTPEM